MLNKLSIVIEETGEHGGKGFSIRIDGLTRELNGLTMEELTPAEYWIYKTYNLALDAMENEGHLDLDAKVTLQ